MMGEPFFDCQIGFVGCRAICLKGIMGVKDFEENINRRETVSQNLPVYPFFFFFWIEFRVNEVLIEVFNYTKKICETAYIFGFREELYCFPL